MAEKEPTRKKKRKEKDVKAPGFGDRKKKD